jgi:uncharacterized protein YuzB (UPF0349 family)
MRITIIIVNIISQHRGDAKVTKIKYCCRNFDKMGSKTVYKTLKGEHPDLKHKKKDCLGECKLCSRQCVAVVGKCNVVCAASPEKLYKKLKELIHA